MYAFTAPDTHIKTMLKKLIHKKENVQFREISPDSNTKVYFDHPEGFTRMKTLLAAVLVASGLVLAASCKQLSPPEIEERAGQQHFAVLFRAARDLNLYRGEASSLSICAYQLSDSRAFNILRDDPEAMAALLACEQFDDSVVGRERLFVNPGERKTATFERRMGARYLALAAGYHTAGDAREAGATLLLELPAVTLKTGRRPPPRLGVVLESGRMLRDRSVR